MSVSKGKDAQHNSSSEIQIKTTMRDQCTLTKMAKINIPGVMKDGMQLEL